MKNLRLLLFILSLDCLSDPRALRIEFDKTLIYLLPWEL